MKRAFVLIIPLSLAIFGCGGGSSSAPPPPSQKIIAGEFVFTANSGSSNISAFQPAEPITGSNYLVPVSGSPFSVASAPTALAGGVGPSFLGGIFDLVVASASQKTIYLFNVDSTTGALSGPVSNVTTSYTPAAVTVWQSYFYVANKEGNVSAYQVASNGTVTQVPGSPFAAGAGPVALATGVLTLYVANSQSNNISTFAINPSTGALTPVTGSPYPAGTTPSSITAINPLPLSSSSSIAYFAVTNQGSNSVSVYSAASNGSLTKVQGSPFATGSAPSSGAPVLGVGSIFFYVANSGSNNVSGYDFDAASGVLTPLPGSPFAAGTNPVSLTSAELLGPLYVANSGSNNLSVFTVSPASGALSPVATSPLSIGNSPQQVFLFQTTP